MFGSFYTFSAIQMNSTIDLATLLERVPNATITEQLSDLNALARRLIADTVKDVLQISETTLWRWAKVGYRLPVMIGGQKRYKQSDIERLVC